MYTESVDDDDNDDDDDCDEAAADDDLGCDDDVVVPTMNLNKSYIFLGPLWAGEGPPPPSGPDVVAVAFSPVMDAEKVEEKMQDMIWTSWIVLGHVWKLLAGFSKCPKPFFKIILLDFTASL